MPLPTKTLLNAFIATANFLPKIRLRRRFIRKAKAFFETNFPDNFGRFSFCEVAAGDDYAESVYPKRRDFAVSSRSEILFARFRVASLKFIAIIKKPNLKTNKE